MLVADLFRLFHFLIWTPRHSCFCCNWGHMQFPLATGLAQASQLGHDAAKEPHPGDTMECAA